MEHCIVSDYGLMPTVATLFGKMMDDEDDSIREELCYRHPGPPFRGPVNDHESGKPANYPTQACSRTGQLHRNSPLAPKEGFTLGAVYLGLDYTRVAALIYPKICRAIQEKISLAQMMVQIRRKHRSCCGIGNSNAPSANRARSVSITLAASRSTSTDVSIGIATNGEVTVARSTNTDLTDHLREEVSAASGLQLSVSRSSETKAADKALNAGLGVGLAAEVDGSTGANAEEGTNVSISLAVELATKLVKTAKECTNTSSDRSIALETSLGASGESARDRGTSSTRELDVALSSAGNTSGKKTTDESTDTELGLGVDGALDVASAGDESIETSAELDGCNTVGLARDVETGRDVGIATDGSTDGSNTLDDSLAVVVREIKTDLGLDLSLESGGDTGTALEPSTDTSAD
ncbi:hypothetical protein E2P81_ATG10405 [Venturia nashicola]|nr:hypothetical protein E2P81_ATG10405 [Venturia nashicola]